MIFISDEERQILIFLKSAPDKFFSGAEVSRRASSKKEFAKNPRWALHFLLDLTDKKLIERDAAGHFKFLKDP
jgi:hypothetical protein